MKTMQDRRKISIDCKYKLWVSMEVRHLTLKVCKLCNISGMWQRTVVYSMPTSAERHRSLTYVEQIEICPPCWNWAAQNCHFGRLYRKSYCREKSQITRKRCQIDRQKLSIDCKYLEYPFWKTLLLVTIAMVTMETHHVTQDLHKVCNISRNRLRTEVYAKMSVMTLQCDL